MATPFDATLRQMVETRPTLWLNLAGIVGVEAEAIDANLSTISAEADKVLKTREFPPRLVHLEFQSGYDSTMGVRMLRYNVLLDYRHEAPVESVVFLLSRRADGTGITGRVERVSREGERYFEFRYRVVRLWQLSAESLLMGSVEALPLVPLTDDFPEKELPTLIGTMQTCYRAEADPQERRELWLATYLLMGLKYPQQTTDVLLRGVRELEESSTYQAILERGKAEGKLEGRVEGKVEGKAEGRAEEARNWLLRLGRKRFGEPNSPTQARIEQILDAERLEALGDRLMEVENWEELFAEV